jgi:thiol-disulfide isomerase/thioredoxin
MYRVKLPVLLLLSIVLPAMFPASAAVVGEVRSKLSAGDLFSAEAIAEDYHLANGANSEYAAAIAWLARGALMLGKTEAAAHYLAETKALVPELLKNKRVEDDDNLESAIGTSIEVEAQTLAAAGHRDQAVAFLEAQLPRWKTWPLQSRIHKNLDLLTLEGQPAPELDAKYRGSPVLLFLWAHWCSDCKAQGPTIARLKDKYEPRGLRVVAPTRRYGYVPKVENPTAEQEDQEIERVWKTSYAGLDGAPHPIGEALMLRYGVSATPTLVLVDRQGIVRLYTPTRMTEAELSRRIEALLAETPAALH